MLVPPTPIKGEPERQLFTSLARSGGVLSGWAKAKLDAEKMAKLWRQKVDFKQIFPKLPAQLSTYFTTWTKAFNRGASKRKYQSENESLEQVFGEEEALMKALQEEALSWGLVEPEDELKAPKSANHSFAERPPSPRKGQWMQPPVHGQQVFSSHI